MRGSDDIKWYEWFLYPVYLMICVVLLPIYGIVGTTQLIIKIKKEKTINKEKHNEQS